MAIFTSSKKTWHLTWTALLALASACSRGPTPPKGEAIPHLDIQLGNAQVHSYIKDFPEWRIKPVLTLGTADDGPEAFGRIAAIVADESGNIYVGDAHSREILVFGPNGEHLHAIARRGRGPGEIEALASVAWVGDTLAVLDPTNRRISLFARDGSWIDSWPHLRGGSGPPNLFRLYPTGPAEFYAIELTESGDRFDRQFRRFNFKGATPHVLPYADGQHAPQNHIICHVAGGFAEIIVPFAPEVLRVPAPDDQVVVTWTGEYRIAFLSSEGQVELVIDRDRVRIPITPAEWDAASKPFSDYMRRHPNAKCDPRYPDQPGQHPAIHVIVFDDQKRMWVEVPDEEGFVWDVYDDGIPIGSLRTPNRDISITPYIRNNHIYSVSTDELGVQYITVYRVAENEHLAHSIEDGAELR